MSVSAPIPPVRPNSESEKIQINLTGELTKEQVDMVLENKKKSEKRNFVLRCVECIAVVAVAAGGMFLTYLKEKK